MDCEISEQAARDLEDIFDYTEEEFGLNKAVSYVSTFDDIFQNLADNPKLGRKRGEIKKGLRSHLKENHIIFYRLIKTHIRIVRILHGSRDLPKQF
jgi:toxin ParE1/3/4